ncbi:hypothetical protein OKHIF_07770 [Mycobacteroides chelonae]
MRDDGVGLRYIDDGGKELPHRKSCAAELDGDTQPADPRFLEQPNLVEGILVVKVTFSCPVSDLGEQIPVGLGAGQCANFED